MRDLYSVSERMHTIRSGADEESRGICREKVWRRLCEEDILQQSKDHVEEEEKER